MNKRGLTIIVIILLTVAIAISIVIGFCVYKKNKQESTNNNRVQKNVQVENEIKKSETILKFEKYLRENGEKIELEKLDTTNWKTYTDKKRGFSFKYPEDWYAIGIDSSEFMNKKYSLKGQLKEEKFLRQGGINLDGHNVKALLQEYPFLCVFKKNKHESIQNILRKNSSDKLTFFQSDYHSTNCDIVFNESLPRLKKEKRSSGEIWLEHYLSIEKLEYLRYNNVSNAYISTGSMPGDLFRFIIKSEDMIIIMDNYALKESKVDMPTFHTILQTLKYTK